MKKLFLISAVTLTIMFTGCAEKVVSTQPQEVIVERGAPPFANAIWIDNEYAWRRGEYVLVPAHYARENGDWVPGHWKTVPGGYHWVRGHWR